MDRHSRNAASASHRRLHRQAAAGALCVVTTGVLVLGHLWDKDRPAAPAVEPPGQVAAPDARPVAPPARQPPATADAPRPAPLPAPASGIYRCRDGARVVYADRPCGTGSEAVELPPPSAGLQPDRSYAEQLERVRAERARHAASRPVARADDRAPASQGGGRCATIDAQIRQIDAATRQPQTVPMAEYYREQRRSLMDERFSLGCNG